jgi:1-acyl-sn-glycerol-3-phosphate acyltransferase
MIFIRSLVSNVVFYIVLIICIIIAPITFILPRIFIFKIISFQSYHLKINLRYIVNLEVEYRGIENIPKDRKYLIASKHQSLAEACFMFDAIDHPSVIAKKQLLLIPVVGLAFKKANFIYVNRNKGQTNIQAMVESAKKSMDLDPRPLLIFPEGTRTYVGEKKPYKYGVTALYSGLDVPCLPVAINAGYYWSRRRFLRYPGKIIIEFLKPIQPGLSSEDFSKEVYNKIEDASDLLLEEAIREYPK